jgi:ubiquinone/menaquinone biosynthesis C-methylase UbiE
MPSQPVRHPVFAKIYARLSLSMERTGVGKLRGKLLAGLTGSAIEVGAGNGLNFAHYPVGVTSVLAIEPEPHLRTIAEQNARRSPVPVTVVDGVAERLPADDASFDAGVAALMLCSVADPAAALAELHRVLRPGAELRFFEHVRAETPGLGRVQRLADRTVWPFLFGGCHASRDTVAAIEAAGFRIEQVEHYRLPDSAVPWPTSPHVRGVAVRL